AAGRGIRELCRAAGMAAADGFGRKSRHLVCRRPERSAPDAPVPLAGDLVRVWVEDLKYHLAVAMRAVGVALAAVAFASALGSEAQQNADIRSYLQVATMVVAVLVAQWLTNL